MLGKISEKSDVDFVGVLSGLHGLRKTVNYI